MTEQKINGLHRTDEMIIDSYQAYELKDNWKWLNFSDVFTNATSSKKKVKQKEYLNDGKYPIIDQGQDAIGGFFDDDKMVFEGDLPIIIFGDHTRCIKYVDYIFIQGADGVKVLAPKIDIVNPRFAYFMMINLELPDKGYSRHFKYLKNSKFPIPPLPEQQRIINRIESLFEKIDEAETLINEAREGFEKRKEAILAKAFRGDLTEKWREENDKLEDVELILEKILEFRESSKLKKINKKESMKIEKSYKLPETWKWASIAQIATKVTDGEHKTPVKSETGYYLLSARNVRDGYIALEKVDFVEEDEYLRIKKRCNPEKGDILISCSGSVGRVSVVDKNNAYVMVRSAALVKIENTMIVAKYLEYALRNPYSQEQIRNKSKSTAQSNLFLGPIKSLSIPLMPYEEQKKISEVLDVIFEEEKKLNEVTMMVKEISIIKKAILAKAFRGELGTNKPEEKGINLDL